MGRVGTALKYSLIVSGLTLALTSCQEQSQTTDRGGYTPTFANATATPTAPRSDASGGSQGAVPGQAQLGTGVREVAKRTKPAVVQITNEQVAFDRLNGAETVPAGVGSGVIYDQRGFAVTNAHVIEGAHSLRATLPDGRSFPASLVGSDPKTDLAVVKVEGDNLPVAEFGDSSQLQVGDWVVAIGNALGLPGGPTVTAGVVSAMGRTVQEPGSGSGASGPFLFDVIQTDAAINPGNSGGPLVNLDGQVVGINTMVATQAEPGVIAQGIGFAIAVNRVKPIADQLVTTGRAVHPALGIRYTPLTTGIASQLGVNAKAGAVVMDVQSGSPAASAGLKARDVIVAVDGKPMTDESSLPAALDQHKPGDSITLTVVREGREQSVKVTLAG